ncbi:hypothetical protein [Azospirillum griseum]|uniref:Uncharacterized protein n=1 Tax=Azospirillum griseum TaxID=2496639 RepID=A0A3S0K7M7_9PROT|nr:hypothetical protein [Azospirillum griseum]RTR23655.1 hypothetical protein EJ903_03770 [Azospirillum griseum]
MIRAVPFLCRLGPQPERDAGASQAINSLETGVVKEGRRSSAGRDWTSGAGAGIVGALEQRINGLAR